ncbi:hypothetical protein BOTBODRAFT_39015 [Botryobasidium botryosum FD-172 SS1]|uniref:Uncharacterized protein n=1 Tax=Botryobasidium botryosum (strain FD-172 SS1) TaxID=930990 RepID=A0A067LXV3_BOTB1|nr:hypothetical protein BOTBODRAFT_39015 [Botryobasidium botryosum FD-172 SS1]
MPSCAMLFSRRKATPQPPPVPEKYKEASLRSKTSSFSSTSTGSVQKTGTVISPFSTPANTPPQTPDLYPPGIGGVGGYGWGKIIPKGNNFSIATLGNHNQRTDTTKRLAELRKLMKAEPDGGIDF